PNHRELVRQIIDIVHKLGRAKLGHNDLHLGNCLLSEGKLYLLDGYAVRRGGLKTRDILLLGHSVSRFATTADKLRAGKTLSHGAMPLKNPVRKRQWRKFLESSVGENAYFSRLRLSAGMNEWDTHFFKHGKFPRRWAPASNVDVSARDWQREFPRLLERLDRDELEVLK